VSGKPLKRFGDDGLVGKLPKRWRQKRRSGGRKRRRQHKTLLEAWRFRATWYGTPILGLLIGIWATLRFSLLAPDPPTNTDNLCEIFREHPA
jgi:hypothetical protein